MSELIKLKDIESQFNKTNKYSEHYLDDGRVIKYYRIFSEKRLDNLMKEYVIVSASEDKIVKEFFADNENFFKYALFLGIKHFTHFRSEIPEDFEKQTVILEWFIDTGLFKTIFEDVFDPEQVEKIFKRVVDVVQIGEKIQKQDLEIKDKMAEAIDPENLKVLKNNENIHKDK